MDTTFRKYVERRKCSYPGCERSKKDNPNLHFFHFPTQRPLQCQQWVKNLIERGNESLKHAPFKSLKSKLVCEKHFSQDNFFSLLRNLLLKTAVPTLDGLEDDEPSGENIEALPSRGNVEHVSSQTDKEINLNDFDEVMEYIFT